MGEQLSLFDLPNNAPLLQTKKKGSKKNVPPHKNLAPEQPLATIAIPAKEEVVEEKIVVQEIVQEEKIAPNVVEEKAVVQEVVQEEIIASNIVEEKPTVQEIVQEEIIAPNIVEEKPIVQKIVQEEIIAPIVEEEKTVVQEIVQEEVIASNIVEEKPVVQEIVQEEVIAPKKIVKEKVIVPKEKIPKEKYTIKPPAIVEETITIEPIPAIDINFIDDEPDPKEETNYFSKQENTTVRKKRGRKSFKEIDSEIDLINIPVDEELFKKQYYPISVVAKWFRVNASLLRFWENEFTILKPRKTRKGDRLFRPEDVKNLQLIYHLLRQRKFTIEGAKKYLKANKQTADVHLQVIQSLNQFKGFLLELKANLD
jgi:DNA-binding transcriptional MerR regulator